MTYFVVDVALQKAEAIVRKHDIITLTSEERECFKKMLLECLSRHHERVFFSGNDALDRYLKERSMQDVRRSITRAAPVHIRSI